MKIGYLCSDFDIPLYGHEGCSVRIREFTNALVDQGHDVFLLCAELGKPVPVTVKARVIDLGHGHLNELLFRTLDEEAIWSHDLERDLRLIMHNFWLQGAASAIIADERPDVLYEVYALFGSGGIDLAHRHGIPHILEVNAPLCIEQEGYGKFPLHRSAQTLEDEIYRSTDAVVVVSEWLRDFIVKRGANAESVHVIENGVAERLFASPESRGSTRAQLGLVNGERVVGCVATYQVLARYQRPHRSVCSSGPEGLQSPPPSCRRWSRTARRREPYRSSRHPRPRHGTRRRPPRTCPRADSGDGRRCCSV